MDAWRGWQKMKNRRLTMLGVAVMVLGGILLAAQSFAPGGGVTSVLAGNTTPDPTTPPQTSVTPPAVVRTATPKATSTSLPATSTPVPPTAVPTKPPATAPSAGNEGVAVRPPNTGTGGGSG